MTDRRQTILDAALPLFVQKGYAATTISDIKHASGATTGSIYHFFEGKPAIAIALWQIANQAWEASVEKMRHSRTPQEMVETTVYGLAEWALRDRALFLFFEEMRIRALTDPDLSEILEISRQGFEAAAAVYQQWVDQGAVIDIDWPLASALIMGPTYDYLRKSGNIQDHQQNISILASQAWTVIAA